LKIKQQGSGEEQEWIEMNEESYRLINESALFQDGKSRFTSMLKKRE
jgi:hypothetical protein